MKNSRERDISTPEGEGGGGGGEGGEGGGGGGGGGGGLGDAGQIQGQCVVAMVCIFIPARSQYFILTPKVWSCVCLDCCIL